MKETRSAIEQFMEQYGVDSINDLGVQKWKDNLAYFVTEITMRVNGKPFRFYSRCPIEVRHKRSWAGTNEIRWALDSSVIRAVYDCMEEGRVHDPGT